MLWSFSISSSSHLTLIYPTCGCRWRIVSSGGNNENVGKEDREGKGRRMEEKCDGKSNYAEYETWGKTAWCTCDSYEPDVCKINFPLEDVSRRESKRNTLPKKKKKEKKKKSLDKFLIVTILDDISLVNYSEDLLVHIFLLHF